MFIKVNLMKLIFYQLLVLLFFLFSQRGICSTGQSEPDTVPGYAVMLSRYIQIESVSGNEKDAGEFLAGSAKDFGLFVEVFSDEPDSYNFAASLYPLSSGKPNVIFLNHIDVVPEYHSPESRFPPFSGEIHDGAVWGRGAIDNKGQAITQLYGMQKFVWAAMDNDFPYNITMLSVSGEETGGHKGARIISDKFIDLLNPVVVYGEGGVGLKGLLSGDPDRLVFGISVAAKRTLWLQLSLTMDVSGHGFVFPVSYALKEKVKALTRLMKQNSRRMVTFTEPAIDMFYEIGVIEGGLRGILLRNVKLFRPLVVPQIKKDEIIYSLVSNTITLTGFSTQSGPPNNIPGRATSILDCRLLPGVTTEDFLKDVRKWLRNDDIEVEVIEEGIMGSPSKKDQYYEKMKSAILKVHPEADVISILFPASNDNNYFRNKGIPAFGIFPVYLDLELMSSIHSINERLPVNLLHDGIRVYEELIHSFLYGGFPDFENSRKALLNE